jgi:hypothetical protein
MPKEFVTIDDALILTCGESVNTSLGTIRRARKGCLEAEDHAEHVRKDLDPA